MAKLDIDTGTAGNPATGDSLRTAMTKINTNFGEVYQLVGDGSTGLITPGVTNADLKLQPNGTGAIEIDTLQISSSAITSITTNSDITITPNGTGNLVLGALTVQGTTLSSSDSSKITLAENVDITGNLVVGGTFDLSGLAVGTLDVDNLNFNDNIISSDSNADINITPGGTGSVVASGVRIKGTTLSADDSATININEGLVVDGTMNVSGATTFVGNLSVGGNLDVTGTLDLSDSNFTNVGSIQLDSIAGDNDTNTSITFSGSDVITVTAGGDAQFTFNNGSIVPSTDNDIDLGTASLEFKDAFFDGTVTTDALTVSGTSSLADVTMSTSLALASGATVTGIADEDNMSSNSATLLATQQSVKAYVDTEIGNISTTSIVQNNSNITVSDSGTGTITVTVDGSAIGDFTSAGLQLGGSGARVTTVLDEDAMGTNSATALATQQSIKAYVDSTVTNQDLDLQGDSGTIDIDLDSETLDIAGGTNITTAGSGTTLTVNLDTALTGLTSVVVDNVTIADNTITTNASNANLELSANGSGVVTIDGGIDIGDANISFGTATTTSSSAANMDTFTAATHRSAKYQVSIVDSTNTKFGIYEVFVTHDGSSAYINAQGISDTGLDLATFSADIDSGSVRVRVVPISDASTVFKFVRTVFAV